MVFLVGASLVWAFSFGLIKGYLAGLDPVLVSAGRLLLAAAVFAPFLGRASLRGRQALAALSLGALQFGLMYVLYIASYRWLPAWLVALLTIFTPLYVMLLADLRARRFRWNHVLAVLLAMAGAAVVLGRQLPDGADWRGVLLLQGANLCFAVGQVFYADLKRRTGGHDLGLLAWMYQGAALITLLAAAISQPSLAGWNMQAGAVLVYLGLIPTALGFYLWNKGAVGVKRGVLAAANNLKIPLAVLVAWLVFGESASYIRALAGLLLVTAALWVAAAKQRGRG